MRFTDNAAGRGIALAYRTAGVCAVNPELNALHEAQRFLNALAPNEKFTFQTFDDSPADRPLAKIYHGTVAQHAARLTQLNNQGAGIYVMTNRGDLKGRKNINVTGVRVLFADFDGTDPADALALNPHIVVQSSQGKFHCYWRISDCPLNEFKAMQEAIATKFNSDPNVKDIARVMRLPGFLHRKEEPFQTHILSIQDGSMTLAEFKTLMNFPSVASPSGEVIDKSTGEIFRKDTERKSDAALIVEIISGDTFHAPILTLSARYAHRKMNASDIEKTICGFMESVEVKDARWKQRYADVKRTVKGAVAKFAVTPNTPPANGVALFDAPALNVADVRDGTTATRPLTELGNAQRLADLHGEHVRYVPETKGWLYLHDGASWRWDISGAGVRELAAQLPQQIYSDGARFDMTQAEHCAKWARKSQTVQVIGNAVSLLSSMSRIRLSLATIDADPMLIGFDHARQVIDLHTGIARPATPADYITKSLTPCAVGDSAKAVRWLAFLGQIFDNDAELIDWLNRWCGYLLTGKTSEQIFLFFFGLGANGKSVFAETIRHVMGDYARTVASETLAETKRQAGGASPDLADLIGCRLALSTETEDGSALAESFIKIITGGDSITTRKLYCEPVQFTPAFKLLMLGNHRPMIHGTDHGIWRRVRLVPFTRTFTEQERDPHLLDTLKAESPHILAWMVAGCLEWQRRGLSDVPAAIASQTADYRKEQDVIGQFLAECTNTDSAAEVEIGALYSCYQSWAVTAGLRPASKVSLGRRLSERGFVQRCTNGRRLWCGVDLKNSFEESTP